jgi:hypothetical protein
VFGFHAKREGECAKKFSTKSNLHLVAIIVFSACDILCKKTDCNHTIAFYTIVCVQI